MAQEIFPYLPETPVSKLCRELPQAVQEKGREIRTFMPKYGCVNERRNQLHEVIRLSGMNLIIDDTDHQLIIKVASIQSARMQVYFIDNDDYFRRKAVVADSDGTEFADNDDRAIFFARGVLETVKKLRWSPDIIHCHGWMSAMVPAYVKEAYKEDPFFADTKIVYSLYDNGYKQVFPEHIADKVLIDGMSPSSVDSLRNGGSYEALSRFAIDHSDGVILGDENISQSLIDYTDQSGKLILPHQSPESYVDAYNEFYDKVLGR